MSNAAAQQYTFEDIKVARLLGAISAADDGEWRAGTVRRYWKLTRRYRKRIAELKTPPYIRMIATTVARQASEGREIFPNSAFVLAAWALGELDDSDE